MEARFARAAERRLRSLTLGVLGGAGAAALLLGIAALVAGIVAAASDITFSSVLPPSRAAAVLAAGALAGAIAGGIAPRVRSPGGAALLGAAVMIAANAVIRTLDSGAGGWDTMPTGLAGRISLLLVSGLPGLAAPLLWGPVRAAAEAPMPRAAAAIAGRVGALVLAFFAALGCGPALYATALGVIAGLGALPRTDILLMGLAYGAGLLALGAVSLLCLRLAGVPRGRGPLPGFERPPPGDLTRSGS